MKKRRRAVYRCGIARGSSYLSSGSLAKEIIIVLALRSQFWGPFLTKNRRKSEEILTFGASNLEKRILDQILALGTSFGTLGTTLYQKTRFFFHFSIENGPIFIKFSADFQKIDPKMPKILKFSIRSFRAY